MMSKEAKKNYVEEMMHLTEQLPSDLRLEVSLYIFEDTFKQIELFKGQPASFVAWICPLLKPMIKLENQYVFFEGDNI